MKEIKEIINAFALAQKAGKKTALATVVQVEGAFIHQPGARILVTEDGQITGSIGHGLLRHDALQKALSAIAEQQNKLVTYNNTKEDGARIGLRLTQNGVVRVLFEPIQAYRAQNPIDLLRELVSRTDDTALATLFSLECTLQPGTTLLYRNNMLQSTLPAALQVQVLNNAQEVLYTKSSCSKSYMHGDGTLSAFIEFIQPPASDLMTASPSEMNRTSTRTYYSAGFVAKPARA